jgi:hypothetical protein
MVSALFFENFWQEIDSGKSRFFFGKSVAYIFQENIIRIWIDSSFWGKRIKSRYDQIQEGNRGLNLKKIKTIKTDKKEF